MAGAKSLGWLIAFLTVYFWTTCNITSNDIIWRKAYSIWMQMCFLKYMALGQNLWVLICLTVSLYIRWYPDAWRGIINARTFCTFYLFALFSSFEVTNNVVRGHSSKPWCFCFGPDCSFGLWSPSQESSTVRRKDTSHLCLIAGNWIKLDKHKCLMYFLLLNLCYLVAFRRH